MLPCPWADEPNAAPSATGTPASCLLTGAGRSSFRLFLLRVLDGSAIAASAAEVGSPVCASWRFNSAGGLCDIGRSAFSMSAATRSRNLCSVASSRPLLSGSWAKAFSILALQASVCTTPPLLGFPALVSSHAGHPAVKP